jgi:2Fe-2S ferredoxin
MQPVTVHITDTNGTRHTLAGLDGWRLMEVIRDYGLPIPAACDGACACATCHVVVAPAWFAKLTPASGDETMMLADAMEVKDTSRLACQIILSPELEGLEVTIGANP